MEGLPLVSVPHRRRKQLIDFTRLRNRLGKPQGETSEEGCTLIKTVRTGVLEMWSPASERPVNDHSRLVVTPLHGPLLHCTRVSHVTNRIQQR